MKKIGILCFILLAVACEKNEERQRISYRRVSFTVDLTLNHTLENLYAYKVYTKNDLINANQYIETSGVLVFNNGDPMTLGMPFAVYDMRCPYEDRQDVTVSAPNDNYEVICPVCQSKYTLLGLNGGIPVEGPSQERLQDYCISWDAASSRQLWVRNCY